MLTNQTSSTAPPHGSSLGSRNRRRSGGWRAGELLLADHDGDIVDPNLDPRVFTHVPTDLAPDRYAHTTLLWG